MSCLTSLEQFDLEHKFLLSTEVFSCHELCAIHNLNTFAITVPLKAFLRIKT